MAIEQGVLLDETSLYTNDEAGSYNYYYQSATSRDKQLVVVTTALYIQLRNNALRHDNCVRVDIYQADIQSDGTVASAWTRVVYNTKVANDVKTFVANIDATAAGANVNIGTSPYAIAWKIVTKPYSPGWPFDNKSSLQYFVGAGGLSATTGYLNKTTYNSTCDYATYYQGKQLLILNKGFRVAHRGNYKSDKPANYVTFKQDTKIIPGHTVVFKP